METIETVNVSSNSFDAEQGRAGGAAVTVITKGTNTLHGAAFTDRVSPYGVAIYNPMTGDLNGRERLPLASAPVPASRQSPISRRMQERVPQPNFQRLDSNYFASGNQSLPRKATWNRNTRHTLWTKYGAMAVKVQCSYGLWATRVPA